MTRTHAAFLRGISNVPMEPLRAALRGLGLDDVASFGASGNLVFHADDADPRALEGRIAAAVGADAIVRSSAELASIVARDPHAGRAGAAVFLAARKLDEARAEAMGRAGFEGEPPVVDGSNVYFVHPTRHPGRKGIVDFERELGVRGTMRSSKVLLSVLERM